MRAIYCALLLIFAPFTVHALETVTFNVPRLDGVVIDGQSDDWDQTGLQVGVMTDDEGGMKSDPADFTPRFRLAWDERGLLLFADVRDQMLNEVDSIETLWMRDSLEIFVAPTYGEDGYYQTVVTPGIHKDPPAARHYFYDFRVGEKNPELSANTASQLTENGYQIEVLLPWENLDLDPAMGREVGFQLFANDTDEDPDIYTGRYQVQWFPYAVAHGSHAMYILKLAEEPSPPVRAAARGFYFHRGMTRIHVKAVEELADQPIAIYEDDRELGRSQLVQLGDRVEAALNIPLPRRGQAYGVLTIQSGGQPIGRFHIAKDNKAVDETSFLSDIVFTEYVFSGDVFPDYDFRYPLAARSVLGPYTIRAAFYDVDYNLVETPQTPGRYGAVFEVEPTQGRPFTRHQTLLRLPEDFARDFDYSDLFEIEMSFPPEFEISEEAVEAHQPHLVAYVNELMREEMAQSEVLAIILAALYEYEPGETIDWADSPFSLDRAWWAGLKRQLYGYDSIPEPFPLPSEDPDAGMPVLQEGSVEEAGMVADTVERLDAVCREWAAEEIEPFVVCVARNGVVFFHRAYGELAGEPITVDTPRQTASLLKMVTILAMAMMDDAGVMELDIPIAEYLPPLRYFDVPVPLTVRLLILHRSGLPGVHVGWDARDWENRVADIYPMLEVDQRFRYGGVGMYLSALALELLTGDSIYRFVRDHIYGPLGFQDTEYFSASGGGPARAIDIARLGQMYLNLGAYNGKRFLSESMVKEMLFFNLDSMTVPVNLDPHASLLNPNPTPGLSPFTAGGGGAAGSELRIDFANGLVAATMRNAPTPAQLKYQPRFFKELGECIIHEDE